MREMIRWACPLLLAPGAINEVGGKFKEFGCKRILIVVDKNGVKFGFAEKMRSVLEKSGLETVLFDGALPDPPVHCVDKGAALAKEKKIDGIAAIGGGSVLDTGKGINILMNNPGSLENYLAVSDPLPVIKPGVPLILLPTTAGTGSEVSTAGVYTNAAGVKRGAYISGTFAVVDPELAVSLPASVTAGCGMDAFAHAAENLVSIFESEFDKMLDFDSIKRIMKWLPAAVQDGKDIEARSQMGFAASMAILGGCSTGLNINHACAHTLGAAFHLPHGDLCGICLPETTRRNAKVAPQKVRTLGEAMGIYISPQASPVEIGETVAQAITDFLRKVGVKSLKAHGIKRDDLVNRGSELSKTMAGDPCMVTAPTKDLPSESYDDIWVKFYDDYQ